MKIKKIVAVVLAAVLVFALAACGSSGTKTTTAAGGDEGGSTSDFTWNGQKEVWCILPTTGVPGLLIHADSLGYVMEKEGFTYVTKDAQGDPSKQVSFVEDAIAAGNVGALMIAAMDVDMLEDVCAQAKDAGIAVCMLGVSPDYEIAGYIATAYSITGMAAVQAAQDWVENRVKEGGNVPKNSDGLYEIACDVYYDITDGIYRSNAMIGTAESSGFFKVVSATQSYGDSAQTDAYDNAQAVLAANPDCRVFIAYEPDEAMGAASAIADYATQNNLDLADFCVIPCYSVDDTFLTMYSEAEANHSANAVKGYSTYGGTPTDEDAAEFAAAGATETGMTFSATGQKLATILLGVCGIEGYEWTYGDAYFDDISATNVYGYEYSWKQGDENPCTDYEVDYAMYQ